MSDELIETKALVNRVVSQGESEALTSRINPLLVPVFVALKNEFILRIKRVSV